MAVNVMLMMDEVHLVKYNPMMKQVVGDSYHGWIDNSEADENVCTMHGSATQGKRQLFINCGILSGREKPTGDQPTKDALPPRIRFLSHTATAAPLLMGVKPIFGF